MTRAFAAGMGAAFAAFFGFGIGLYLLAAVARRIVSNMDANVGRGIRKAMQGAL